VRDATGACVMVAGVFVRVLTFCVCQR